MQTRLANPVPHLGAGVLLQQHQKNEAGGGCPGPAPAVYWGQEDSKGPLPLQLTLRDDYAVRVAIELASQPHDTTVKTGELGRRTGVPPAYLSKIVQALAHAGVVRTRRGARGGVSLLRPASAITLREIIEAVEGPIYLNRCLVQSGLCPRDGFCTAHPVWSRIQALVTGELDAVHLAELAKPGV